MLILDEQVHASEQRTKQLRVEVGSLSQPKAP